jgi:hypothetical protein
MLCAIFNSVLLCKFRRNLVRFPKFRKFRKRKPSENRGNFKIFRISKIRKFRKVCAFSVFHRTRSAQQGTLGKIKIGINRKFWKVVPENPENPFPWKPSFFRGFSGFLYVAKIAYFCKKFRMKFSRTDFFWRKFPETFRVPEIWNSEKCENGHFQEIQHF